MNTAAIAAPFDLSRRLTGVNPYFAQPGAALEAAPIVTRAIVASWRARVTRACAELGWPEPEIVVRCHARGVSLALTAPLDQLFCATEVNEWALWAALHEADPARADWPAAPGFPAAWDEASARATLAACARAERDPALIALVAAADARGLEVLIDDDHVALGGGCRGRAWPRGTLPAPAAVDWPALDNIPVALVTGSNGKTTTTRLLAAMARGHGWRTAWSSTDGVLVDGALIDGGDYSGPAGARLALSRRDVDAAILETARGGILRRGIAPHRARVAVVTNVSDDHFGEYGVDSLDDLAAVKLTVAKALDAGATLVINGDDAVLRRHAATLAVPQAWFALDADAEPLLAARAAGASTCGVRDGRLRLETAAASFDLGEVAAMPLAFGGAARYNVANLAAAALAGHLLGIDPPTIASVVARFGVVRADNPGRLEHFAFGGIEAFVDFAHNPDGLEGLLAVACGQRHGPLALILGQAGNRTDAEIRALAATAARHRPAHVVLKDIAGYLRGRVPGEVPALLRAALLDCGVAAEAIEVASDEYAAVLAALARAEPGATLALSVLTKASRDEIEPLLDRLAASGWRAGEALPAWTAVPA